MKRVLVVLLVLAMCAGIGCMTGCKNVRLTDEEMREKTKAELKETATDDKETAECTEDYPNEKQFDVPLYKDKVVTSSIVSNTTETEGVISDVSIGYETTSDFKTVADWYKGKISEEIPANGTTTDDGKQTMSWRVNVDGNQTVLTITETENGTTISVIKTMGAGL